MRTIIRVLSLGTFIGFASILLFACGQNKPTYEELEGRWSLHEAKRNGRITHTLENVFFQFRDDKTMATNLLGTSEDYSIEYKYPDIHVESSQLQGFDVIRLMEDTLLIRTKIRDFSYDLELLKTGE